MTQFWLGFLYCYFIINLISLLELKYMMIMFESEMKTAFERYKWLRPLTIMLITTLLLFTGTIVVIKQSLNSIKDESEFYK